jgi:hypothetical protein
MQEMVKYFASILGVDFEPHTEGQYWGNGYKADPDIRREKSLDKRPPYNRVLLYMYCSKMWVSFVEKCESV